jgi:hypothetical protein
MATFRKVVPSRKKLESKKLESKKLQGIRKKRGTNFGQFTAKLSIGKEREKLCVHADLLCMNLPFFRHSFAILSLEDPVD